MEKVKCIGKFKKNQLMRQSRIAYGGQNNQWMKTRYEYSPPLAMTKRQDYSRPKGHLYQIERMCYIVIMVRTKLSKRQHEVLILAAKGLTVNEMARILTISPRTVKHHLALARCRLDAVNTTHAVAIYFINVKDI